MPGSDLLKAVHAYVSDFYARNYGYGEGVRGEGADWRSLDETALLAVGVLLEEACVSSRFEMVVIVITSSAVHCKLSLLRA